MSQPTILGNRRHKFVALAISSALATTALGGCTTQASPRAEVSASKAERALAKGKSDKAIMHAEAAVLAEPRNAAYRAMLGATYMELGRFQSAATSFDDAMSLGDNSPRTALSLALAQVASGNSPAAVAVLNDWRGQIAAEDLGLALALAGQADQGVEVLSNALRNGASTAKLRQNLAYAYALQGDWRAARVMAAEDVPADKLDARITEWAQSGKPEDYQLRVAGLLRVPMVADTGQPLGLALNNHPSSQQMAAEAAAMVPAPAATAAPIGSDYAYAENGELPAVSELPVLASAPAPTPAPAVATEAYPLSQPAKPENFQDAFAAPAPTGATFADVASSAVQFVSNPVVQRAPVRYGAQVEPSAAAQAAPAPARRVSGQVESGNAAAATAATPIAAASGSADGSHLVQLGSFASEAGARRAWGIYVKRYPQLSGSQMVITEAKVRGKKYYRVSAGGFQSADASSMCSSVKKSGHGCIAWAEGKPVPGALARETRMASR